MNGEHNGVGFMEMPRIFGVQNNFFFGTEPFDSVYGSARYRSAATVQILASLLIVHDTSEDTIYNSRILQCRFHTITSIVTEGK